MTISIELIFLFVSLYSQNGITLSNVALNKVPSVMVLQLPGVVNNDGVHMDLLSIPNEHPEEVCSIVDVGQLGISSATSNLIFDYVFRRRTTW